MAAESIMAMAPVARRPTDRDLGNIGLRHLKIGRPKACKMYIILSFTHDVVTEGGVLFVRSQIKQPSISLVKEQMRCGNVLVQLLLEALTP